MVCCAWNYYNGGQFGVMMKGGWTIVSNSQIYVISMLSSQERREHIRTQFEKQNIDFKFFDAFVPSERLNQTVETIIPNLAKTWLSPGERGCFMSHLMLWKECIDNHMDYLYVFEDDVILSSESSKFLNNTSWLRERFGNNPVLVRLETFLMPIDVSQSVIADYDGRQFVRLHNIHYGTAGYVISYEAAKQFYSAFLQLAFLDLDAIDELMFKHFLENPIFPIYQLSPAICVQEEQLNKDSASFTSQLEAQREIKRQNIERAFRQQKLSDEQLLPNRISQHVRLRKNLKEKIIYFLTFISRKRAKRRLKREEQERLRLIDERLKVFYGTGEVNKENKIIEFQ